MSLEARVFELERRQDEQFEYIAKRLDTVLAEQVKMRMDLTKVQEDVSGLKKEQVKTSKILTHILQEQTDIKDYVKMINYACVSQPKSK